MTAAAQDASCASGAAAGVAQSIFAGLVDKPNLADFDSFDDYENAVLAQVNMIAIIGGLVGYATSGGDANNVTSASSIARSGFINNFLTHAEEDELKKAEADCAADPSANAAACNRASQLRDWRDNGRPLLKTGERIEVDFSGLTPAEEKLAREVIAGAIDHIHAMSVAGTLPASSIAAVSALKGIAVSTNMSGYDHRTGVFNIKASEIQAWYINNTGRPDYPANLVAIVAASMIVHDGYHGVQNANGELVNNHYATPPAGANPFNITPFSLATTIDPSTGLPTVISMSPAANTFNSHVLAQEINANIIQEEFIRAAVPPYLGNWLVNSVFEEVDTPFEILNRYWRRADGP